ncbi:MAG: hypothetical protein A2516_04440 [Alphaproteobacteria bacterium RIFOXYD12_FULL_60_8]|nr:MAG: hypothetical protein A2516_04440 [Alphaproteobacteria bacterium RIFOXYD12_FULL_60_8]
MPRLGSLGGIVLVLCCWVWAAAGEVIPGPIPAQVRDVVDGDTLKVIAAIWPGHSVLTLVRVDGVDTPEIKGKCPEEIALAQQAKAFVQVWAGEGRVQLENIQLDKYAGRVLARVRNEAGERLDEGLLSQGLARPYEGEKRAPWCGY